MYFRTYIFPSHGRFLLTPFWHIIKAPCLSQESHGLKGILGIKFRIYIFSVAIASSHTNRWPIRVDLILVSVTWSDYRVCIGHGKPENHGICYNFNFQARKVMEFKWRLGKTMEKQYSIAKWKGKSKKKNKTKN